MELAGEARERTVPRLEPAGQQPLLSEPWRVLPELRFADYHAAPAGLVALSERTPACCRRSVEA